MPSALVREKICPAHVTNINRRAQRLSAYPFVRIVVGVDELVLEQHAAFAPIHGRRRRHRFGTQAHYIGIRRIICDLDDVWSALRYPSRSPTGRFALLLQKSKHRTGIVISSRTASRRERPPTTANRWEGAAAMLHWSVAIERGDVPLPSTPAHTELISSIERHSSA